MEYKIDNLTQSLRETNPELQLIHVTIIQTGTTCKKIPCYMRDSACRWFKKAKIF